MKRAKGLQITSFVLLLTQIISISTEAQTAFVKTSGPNLDQSRSEPPVNDMDPTKSSPAIPEESQNSSTVAFRPGPTALTSRDPRKLGVIDQAYLDVFIILNEDNQCSRFFGGRFAIMALNELVQQLKPKYLDRNVAIRMSGQTTTFKSNSTGFSFRLFEKAEVNLAGSFFRSNSPSERRVSVSSIFAPNTRETRAVVLLHELGHLVKTSEDRWVLADDGTSISLSLENTDRIISVCRQQIDSLAQLKPAQELEMTLSLAQKSVGG